MRRLASFIAVVAAITSVALPHHATASAPIYRWTDDDGVHFSNRPESIPSFAAEVELPPLPVPAGRSAELRGGASSAPPRARYPREAACEPSDPSVLAQAVASRLGGAGLGGLTLFVGGVPVAYDPESIITLTGPDATAEMHAAAAEGSIAYPAGGPCPTQPPLPRYAVANGHAARGLCDDYRRAFAAVGVAGSRDQSIARSFHEIADAFTRVAANRYVAATSGPLFAAAATGGVGPDVPLPPWVVEAHVAQTDELGGETSALVEELTVALAEIDRAAHALGCW